MKTFENIATLEELNLVELNATQMQEVEGGIIPLIIGGLLLFDVALWSYILA